MKRQKFDSNRFKIKYLIRIAVSVLGTAILFCACKQNDLEKIKAFTTSEELPMAEAENFKTLYSDSGIVRFSLKAAECLRYENGGKNYMEFPKGVYIVEYDSGEKITSTLKADYAKQFEKEDKWEAKNNVVVTNEKGDTLKTEHLILDNKKQKIFSDEFVTIVSEDQIITGIGLEADQDMKNWEIKDPSGFIYLDSKNKAQKNSTTKPQSQKTNIKPLTETKELNKAKPLKVK